MHIKSNTAILSVLLALCAVAWIACAPRFAEQRATADQPEQREIIAAGPTTTADETTLSANDTVTATVPQSQPNTPAEAVRLVEIASGLDQPVDIQQAGDERLFIVEQPGRIRIIDEARSVLSQPFLDIADEVDDSRNEMGLLGLAFHPDYATNGHFFVNYTVGSPRRTRITRFQVSADPNVADPASRTIILEFSQPHSNHNGGQIQFGPDGYLYIATGDGGSGGDPDDLGQNNGQLLGKLLRIDVDVQGTLQPDCNALAGETYSVPADNPFAGDGADSCDEIWATGLRNPWRFSFDRLTHDLWIGDVGQRQVEEINFRAAGESDGGNYGWRCYEGEDEFNLRDCGDRSSYIFPVHQYGHSNGRCSVTGGVVYRGNEHPVLSGQYFFADYCSGDLWSLSGTPANPTVTLLDVEGSLSLPTSFGEDKAGEVYVASRGGSIYHIQGTEVEASVSIDHQLGAPGSQFTVSALDFRPTTNVDISVNETYIDTLRTDSGGSLAFHMGTANLLDGTYHVELTGNVVLAVEVRIDSNATVRQPADPSNPTIEIPPAILPLHHLLVPLFLHLS